jgi:DNA helicase II / ATP-dependent DNA helicase PcrA
LLPVTQIPALRPDLSAVLEALNPQQREAAEHTDGPLLIFAGAGSGKTRVLTTRIANLIAKRKAWPERILAVTFTNKAAREMRERVGQLVGEEVAADMWVGTFHHTCVRILRREAPRLGLERSFTIFDDDDTKASLRRVLDGLGLDQKRYPPSLVANAISNAKNELQGPEAIPNRNYFDEVVRRCYVEYEALLKRSGGLDFDDLILSVVRLLQQQEDARKYWQDRFRYVLVDEYQDTNRAQYVLVNLIAAEHRNLAVVGDDDQSIFGWRGADVRNILDFQKDYPDATVVNLEQNYRSSQAILDAAHSVIRHNPDRAPKKLWTERLGGEKVIAVQAYNEVEEAEFVADEIERLRRTENRKHKDFAVLYRTNAQSRGFEDVFVRRRIPYRLVGGVKFWERREVKDLLAYLRILANPADSVSFARVVNVPRRKIGGVSVDRLTAFAREREITVIEALDRAAEAGVPRAALAPIEHFARQLKSLRANVGIQRPSELVDLVIEVMELRAFYDDGTPQGEARIENLAELHGYAEEFDPLDPADGLNEFLAEVTLTSDVDSYDEKEEGVTLITLHMVKGLEFPVVFLVGLEEGLLPHQRSLEEDRGIDEERRLMYVGITRARDRLYLSCAFRRHIFGQAAAGMPSRFLGDIPQALISAPREGRAPAAPPPRHEYRQRLMERSTVAAPAPPPVQRFSDGDRVRHASFGDGVVIKSTLTRTDEELVVKFDRAGLKILSGTLAKLEKVAP